MSLRALLLVGLFLIGTFGTNIEASPAAFVETWAEHFPEVTSVGWGDLTGDGQEEILVAQGDRIQVLRRGGDALELAWELELPGISVTSICVAGPGRLIVGTGQAGTVRCFRLMGSQAVEVQRSSYLWSPVKKILSADLTGTGREEFVALTEKGSVHLFQLDESGLEQLWVSPGDIPLHLLLVADYDGDGRSELVVGDESAVEVLKWVEGEMLTVWKNYPWGQLTGVFQGADRELWLRTGQDVLYAYRWNGETFVLSWSLSDPLLNMEAPVLGQIDDQPAFIGGATLPLPGVGVWKASRSGLEEVWFSGPIGVVKTVLHLPTGEFLVATDRDVVHLWRPVPADYYRAFFDGQPIQLLHPPVQRRGNLWISLRDISELFRLTMAWDRETKSITILKDSLYVILKPDGQQIEVNGQSRILSASPFIQEGVTYVPVDFVRFALGGFVDWNDRTRTLWIQP
jgi:hypothetical protein